MRKIILLGALGLFLFGLPGDWTRAASYDIYVDKNCEDDRDGSEDKPFCDIADALQEVNKGESIYVKNGTYSENVSLPRGVSLVGKSESGVIIKGYIEMAHGSKIESLTVNGSSINVRVDKDADAEIDDCDIKSSSKIGIQTEEGGGKLTVKNSKIRSGGKGLYIQAGKKISLVGNEIYDNKEEGLDIRANVSGEVLGNSIHGNGESGIELIVGKSDLNIKSNSIKSNGASGIANQFYAQWSKEGSIVINSNTLSGNKKYGVDCNIPSKGADQMKAGYWSDSINLKKNKIEKNSLGPVNNLCSLIKVVEEEEKKENEIVEEETASPDSSEASEENPEKDEPAMTENDLSIQEKYLSIQSEFENEVKSLDEIVAFLNGKPGWQKFLWGHSPEKISQMEGFYSKNETWEDDLERLMVQAESPDLVQNISDLRGKIEEKSENITSAMEQTKDTFSLFGWVRSLFFRFSGD